MFKPTTRTPFTAEDNAARIIAIETKAKKEDARNYANARLVNNACDVFFDQRKMSRGGGSSSTITCETIESCQCLLGEDNLRSLQAT